MDRAMNESSAINQRDILHKFCQKCAKKVLVSDGHDVPILLAGLVKNTEIFFYCDSCYLKRNVLV